LRARASLWKNERPPQAVCLASQSRKKLESTRIHPVALFVAGRIVNNLDEPASDEYLEGFEQLGIAVVCGHG
jgi:hypothetical protein